MTIVDLGYIQAFGSIANALGALVFGQVSKLGLKNLKIANFAETINRQYAFILNVPPKILSQIADTTGPKTMFLVSVAFTSVYYCGISMANSWYAFFFLQVYDFQICNFCQNSNIPRFSDLVTNWMAPQKCIWPL